MKKKIYIAIIITALILVGSSIYLNTPTELSSYEDAFIVAPEIEYHFDLVENPSNLKELTSMSPIILEISNPDQRSEVVDMNGIDFIYSDVKVISILKDTTESVAKNSTIKLLEYGLDDVTKKQFLIHKNKKYMVFLKKIDDPNHKYAYRTVGLYYGQFANSETDAELFINDKLQINNRNSSIKKSEFKKYIILDEKK